MDESLINIFNYVNKIAAVVPVVISLVSIIIYKLLPYLKNKISEYNYLNMKVLLVLINYELIGSLVFILISVFLAPVFFRTSSWKVILLRDYLLMSVFPFLIFILGIVVCIRKERESNKCKYLSNILLGIIIYISIYSTTILSFWDKDIKNYNSSLGIIICMIIILQITNIRDPVKVKEVEYVVYVASKEKYKSYVKPTKEDGFYVIKINNGKRILKIPIDKVKKIEININDIN